MNLLLIEERHQLAVREGGKVGLDALDELGDAPFAIIAPRVRNEDVEWHESEKPSATRSRGAENLQAGLGENLRKGADATAVIFADVIRQILPCHNIVMNLSRIVARTGAPAVAQTFDVPPSVLQ